MERSVVEKGVQIAMNIKWNELGVPAYVPTTEELNLHVFEGEQELSTISLPLAPKPMYHLPDRQVPSFGIRNPFGRDVRVLVTCSDIPVELDPENASGESGFDFLPEGGDLWVSSEELQASLEKSGCDCGLIHGVVDISFYPAEEDNLRFHALDMTRDLERLVNEMLSASEPYFDTEVQNARRELMVAPERFVAEFLNACWIGHARFYFAERKHLQLGMLEASLVNGLFGMIVGDDDTSHTESPVAYD